MVHCLCHGRTRKLSADSAFSSKSIRFEWFIGEDAAQVELLFARLSRAWLSYFEGPANPYAEINASDSGSRLRSPTGQQRILMALGLKRDPGS